MSVTIAIFGGSFDPPHVAHTLVASYVLSTLPVDQLLVVPAAEHPFEKQLTPFHHRIEMCRLAMGHLRNTDVSDIEAELGGESRTLRTLEAICKRRPEARLRLVIGSDLLPDVRHWHNFPAIEALAPPIVVQRAGHVTDATRPSLPAVSSTDIRRRIRDGASLEGLVGPTVVAYIQDHGLYR